MVMKKGDN